MPIDNSLNRPALLVIDIPDLELVSLRRTIFSEAVEDSHEHKSVLTLFPKNLMEFIAALITQMHLECHTKNVHICYEEGILAHKLFYINIR